MMHWLTSIATHLAPINSTLRLHPIEDIIQNDSFKHAMVRQAVKAYVTGHSARLKTQVPAPIQIETNNQFLTRNDPMSPSPRSAHEVPPASTAHEPSATPGVCTAAGGEGVGCSYDVTMVEGFALSVLPKRSAVKMDECDHTCYENMQDACNPSPGPCQHCIYCPYITDDDTLWRIPTNVVPHNLGQVYTCTDNFTSSRVEDYQSRTSTSHSLNIPLFSHSKTTTKFYEEYYKNDSALSLALKNIVHYSLTLFPGLTRPSDELALAVKLLPEVESFANDSAADAAYQQAFGSRNLCSTACTLCI